MRSIFFSSGWSYSARYSTHANRLLFISSFRYDLSEPRFGKDVWDRVISPLKGAIRRYCSEGHDVISAADMHRALKARPVKGCTAAVCELDRTRLEIKVNRIPNFSTFHNFSYEEDGLRTWKAYDIGQGKFVSWSDLDVQVPSTIALQSAGDDLQFWDVQPRTMELQKESDTEAPLFKCNESGCSYTFQSYEALQDHLNFANHDPISTSEESVYDKLRRDWVAKFSSLSISDQREKTPTAGASGDAGAGAGSRSRHSTAGWALQKPRGSGQRFSENVKSYLQSRFNVGVQTGRKCDPGQVSAEMRTAKQCDGTRRFSRAEWLTKV